MRISGYEARVQVENMAISDGTYHRVELFPGRWHSSSEWNIVGHDVEGNLTEPEFEVPATSLDAYFPPGSRVDFVKMDIEGAELQALLLLRNNILRMIDQISVEFHLHCNIQGYTLQNMNRLRLKL